MRFIASPCRMLLYCVNMVVVVEIMAIENRDRINSLVCLPTWPERKVKLYPQ